jgi:hypothetical protein
MLLLRPVPKFINVGRALLESGGTATAEGEPTARVADMGNRSGRYVFVREARMAGREALGGVLL